MLRWPLLLLLATVTAACLDCAQLDEAACQAEPACRRVIASPCVAGTAAPRFFGCADETSGQCSQDTPYVHPKTRECLILACE